MYFYPHFTHSAPPPDTPGALRYHSGDHPRFTSLCHLPDILVSNPCLNSSDLGTSGPRDLRTSESRSLIGTFGPSLSQLCLRYSFLSLSGIPSLDPYPESWVPFSPRVPLTTPSTFGRFYS